VFPTFDWFLLLALLMGMIAAMMTTADILVPDHLWQAIQPLLPTPPPPLRRSSSCR
jgi:hypothetical protein